MHSTPITRERQQEPGTNSETPATNRGNAASPAMTNEARQALLARVQADPLGFRGMSNTEIRVRAVHVPAWAYSVDTQCSWEGEYGVQRTVTKYRSVTRDVRDSSGRVTHSYTDKEPYNELETEWHPTSGVRDFTYKTILPAVQEVSLTQLLHLTYGYTEDLMTFVRPSMPGFGVISQTYSETQAWSSVAGDTLLETAGREDCASCADRVHAVRVRERDRETALVYLPCMILTYTANGSEYRNFFNPRTKEVCGDVPLDLRGLAAQLRSASQKSAVYTVLRRLFGWGSLGIAFLGVREFFLENTNTEFALWMGGIFIVCLIVAAFCNADPFSDLIAARHDTLCRFFLDPPDAIRATVYQGMPEPQLRTLLTEVRQRAETNELKRVDGSVARRVATFLANTVPPAGNGAGAGAANPARPVASTPPTARHPAPVAAAPASNTAAVLAFSRPGWWGCLVVYQIQVDGYLVGELTPNGIFECEVSPGQHTVTVVNALRSYSAQETMSVSAGSRTVWLVGKASLFGGLKLTRA